MGEGREGEGMEGMGGGMKQGRAERGRGKVGVTAAGKKKTVSTSVGQNSTFVE